MNYIKAIINAKANFLIHVKAKLLDFLYCNGLISKTINFVRMSKLGCLAYSNFIHIINISIKMEGIYNK